jgi:thiosulfate/3-mercaptopyruvate sulfurtransferase
VDRKKLPILNGGNQWIHRNGMIGADFQAARSREPNVSVNGLLADNIRLQATIGDMLRALPGTNLKTDGVPFWNARSLSQYSGGEMVEFSEDTNSDLTGTQSCATAFCTSVNPDNYQWTLQNGGSRQGQPFGNLQVSYTHFLDPSKGFSCRPKAFFAKLVKGGATTAQDVAYGNATVAGIGFVEASYGLVVLCKPTRFYDGALVEWNSLLHLLDSNGNCILPSNSPWRSDVKPFFRQAASPSLLRRATSPTPTPSRRMQWSTPTARTRPARLSAAAAVVEAPRPTPVAADSSRLLHTSGAYRSWAFF